MNATGFLLEVAIKSTVILACAAALVALARRFSAEERHLVWVLALLAVLLLPLASAFGPRWVTEGERLSAYSRLIELPSAHPQATETSAQREPNRRREVAAADDIATVATRTARGASLAWIPSLLVSAYLLLAALVAGHFLRQRRRIGRHVATLPAVRSPALLAHVEGAKRIAGVSRDVRVLESPSDRSPWTWGFVRPAVVLPRGFDRWPSRDQQHVLLHELAHIGRRDHAVAIAVQACCALYWFHPLVWWAARRVRHEAERACDDRVLLYGAPGAVYAERLLAIATEVSTRRISSVWIPAMAHRSMLSARIDSILDSKLRRAAVNKTKMVVASLAALGLMVPLAALQSQESARGTAVAELGDPAFQAIVATGPKTSEELERIVTTYAANNLDAEAIDVFTRYLTRDDRSQDPDCWYCISLLWTEGTPRRSAPLGLLTDAMAQVVAEAYEAGSGDTLVPLALMAAKSKNKTAMARGIYHMSAALQFGIDPRWNISVVHFLNEMGRHQDARDLAASLHRDETSMHYQSDEIEQWIEYLDIEIERNEAIAMQFVSLGGNPSSEAREFLPVSKPTPEYPAEAFEAGLEGHVIVEFTVKANGRTADSRVVMSTNPIFEQAALDVTKDFYYLPRMDGGQALDVPGVRNKITFVKP